MLCLLIQSAMAQIVTENAGVVSPETPILREAVSVLAAENLEEVRWSHQVIVALDTRRELKLTLPVLSREVEFDDAGGQKQEADLSGLGDATLRYKQSLWQVDDVMESTRWAFLAELGVPLGEDDAEEQGVEIPRRLQLGTGDWSIGGGTAFTSIRDRHRFSVEGMFRHRTRHEGIQLGESADLNLAYWYRIEPAAFDPEREETEVRGVLELLLTWRFPSEIGDTRIDDDGPLVWLAPGIQVFPGTKVLFEASVQVPLYQDLDDAVGERNWAAVLVIKFLF